METTKNDKGAHQKACLSSWHVFIVILQYSSKFCHWIFSKILARWWLSIWTYRNKFVHFFFQTMAPSQWIHQWHFYNKYSKRFYQRCCLLHLINKNCLLKTFLRTQILMTQVYLYLFSLLELIWNCIIFM